MTIQSTGQTALEYMPCRYGRSKLVFRGPRKRLETDYVAFLGGTETYGKFMPKPFPDLVEQGLDVQCVNFGCVNAGPDVFLGDPFVPGACSKARVTVLEVMGAANLSNRFYSVHPRRNDRFLKPSMLMQTIFRGTDFTEFTFTRHLLSTLQSEAPEKYEIVVDELRQAWLARMRSLLAKIDGKVILLWVKPPMTAQFGPLGGDPLFVDRTMMEQIGQSVTGIVEVDLPSHDAALRLEGMSYTEMDQPAATELWGAPAHQLVAADVTEALTKMV